MSGLDRVVADIDRAVTQWKRRGETGLPDAAALLDLTTACEWLLQSESAIEAQRQGRRKIRGAVGFLLGIVALAAAAVTGLVFVMLQVAP